MRTVRLIISILSVWILLTAAAVVADDGSNDRSFGHVVEVGKIANPALVELSGLARSGLDKNVIWAINDGGNQPLLFAVGRDGADLGSVLIAGARNRDWEDIASFTQESTAYLLIADVGDNHGHRESSTIYIIKEPKINKARLKQNSVKIVARIRFTYEDGPKDCEAVAVTISDKKILLLSKRTSPVVLYELPLEIDSKDSTAIARRKYPVPGISKPSAMDISPRGNSAVILTYSRAYLFARRSGENWQAAFARTPRPLNFPPLLQQEALCFSKNGKSVYISSEGRSAPLLRIDLIEKSSAL